MKYFLNTFFILMFLFIIFFCYQEYNKSVIPEPEQQQDSINYLRDVYKLDIFCVDCLDRIITDMANQFGFDRRLLIALIKVESVSFNIWAVNPAKTCYGLMQVDTNTAKDICVRHKIPYKKGIINLLYNPYYNILIGCIHLAEIREKVGNNDILMLTIYNCGEGNYRDGRHLWPDYKFINNIKIEMERLK